MYPRTPVDGGRGLIYFDDHQRGTSGSVVPMLPHCLCHGWHVDLPRGSKWAAIAAEDLVAENVTSLQCVGGTRPTSCSGLMLGLSGSHRIVTRKDHDGDGWPACCGRPACSTASSMIGLALGQPLGAM